MNKFALVAVLAGAATLAACSPKAQNETAEAGNAVASDMNATTVAAVNSVDAATDNAMDSAAVAADRAGNKVETAADKMKNATGNAMIETGKAVKN